MSDEINPQTHSVPEATPPPEATPGSALETYLNVFFEPRAAFRSLNSKPRWILPVLIIIVMGLLFQVILMEKIGLVNIIKMSGPAAAERMQNLPEEQLQQMESPRAKGFTYVMALVSPVLVLLLLAAIFTGIFTLVDAGGEFKKNFAVITHGMAAYSLVSLGLQSLILVLRDNYAGMDLGNILMSNPGVLLGADHRVLRTLLSSFDLLSFWLLFLWIVGFNAVLRRTTPKKTAVVVIGLWAAYVTIKVAWVAVRPV